jgi:uncharacterized protein DUF4333
MRSRFVRAAVMFGIAMIAVACSKTLDTAGLQTQIEDQLNTKLGTTGITVECPDDVKAEEGNEFDCTGTVPDSGTLTIHVKQTDSDGHVTWEVTDAATGPTGGTGAIGATGVSGPTGTT